MDLTTDHAEAPLSVEAMQVYACLFQGVAPQDFVELYALAHQRLEALNNAPAAQHVTWQKMLNLSLDVAAVEPWLRRANGPRHLVCRKVLLASHLAECSGHSLPALSRDPRQVVSWPVAWLKLAWIGWCGACHLAKGRYLQIRHELR